MKISNSSTINGVWENLSALKQPQNSADAFQRALEDQIKVTNNAATLNQCSGKAPEISLSSQEKSFFNDMFSTPVYSSVVLNDSELSYFNTAFSTAAYAKNAASADPSITKSSLHINV